MWWRICPLFTPLIIHHPVWHYTPLPLCKPTHTSIMRQGCWLCLALFCCDKPEPPSRKRSIIHAQISPILQHATITKTKSKNSNSYSYCAVMKWMLYVYRCICVFVCQLSLSRLQVNPSESPWFHALPVFLTRLCQRVLMPQFAIWKYMLLYS